MDLSEFTHIYLASLTWGAPLMKRLAKKILTEVKHRRVSGGVLLTPKVSNQTRASWLISVDYTTQFDMRFIHLLPSPVVSRHCKPQGFEVHFRESHPPLAQPLLLQARELEKVAALSRFEALEGFVEEEFQLQTYLGPGKLVYIFHQPDPPVISRSSSDSSNL